MKFVCPLGPRLSIDNPQVHWRPVMCGLALQFMFALVAIRWSLGRAALQCLGNKVDTFLKFTDVGSALVYGDQLVTQWNVFAFQVSAAIL